MDGQHPRLGPRPYQPVNGELRLTSSHLPDSRRVGASNSLGALFLLRFFFESLHCILLVFIGTGNDPISETVSDPPETGKKKSE
jgi:hypothetical protein